MAAVLRHLDVELVWFAAEEQECRVLVEESVEWVSVFPDHLEVTVSGGTSPTCPLPGGWLKESDFVDVGGGLQRLRLPMK
jgi:hypothetical protein